MARVFVSYRRADGMYAVGWLAERLRALDHVTGMQTTFHDDVMRAGTDLASRLDAEIAACDVVVAVITPLWHGPLPDGSSRIMDPDDWIVREIAGALRHGTTIIPVLVDGAEHPLPSQMHESIAGLNRLLSVPYRDGADLDRIIDQVDRVLAEIDRDRAVRLSLEQPVEVPRLPQPWLVGGAAALAGISLCVVFALAAGANRVAEGADCTAGRDTVCVQHTGAYDWFVGGSVVIGLFAGAVGVVGAVLARRLVRVSAVEWRRLAGYVVLTGSAVALVVAAARVGYVAFPDIPALPHPELRAVASFAGMAFGSAGLILCVGIPICSLARAEDGDLAGQVAALAIARDAERWGAGMLSCLFAIGATSGSALVLAFAQSDADDSATSAVGGVAFTFVFSAMLLAIHRLAVAELTRRREAIEVGLADLPPRYRANAEPRLQARAFDEGGWGFRLFLALPLMFALVGWALVVAAT